MAVLPTAYGPPVGGMRTEVNVMALGAVGDGVHDDTPAWIRALALRKRLGPGVVYAPRPPVNYTFQAQNYSYSIFYPNFSGCVDVDFGKVTIQGDGSPIVLKTPGGGNPDTNFVLTSSVAVDQDNPVGFVPTPAPAWLPVHAYLAGAHVSGPNGHEYIATNNGTSGAVGPTDLNPATAGAITDGTVIWALFDYVFRGSLFRIKSFALNTDVPFGDVVFRDLILDGGAPRSPTIEAIWPLATAPIPSFTAPYDRPGIGPGGANVPAGIGWVSPIGHMPISMPTPYTYGTILLENVAIKNWRSDTLYRSDGNALSGRFTMRNCTIEGCAANGISMTAPALYENIEISGTSQAIENDPYTFDQTFRGIRIRDGGMGLTLPGNVAFYTGRGRTMVDNCTMDRCSEAGLFISGYMANALIRDVVVRDCGQIGGFPNVYLLGQLGGEPQDIDFINVQVISDTKSSPGGFNVNVGNIGVATRRVRLIRCGVFRTATALAGGFGINQSATGLLGAASDLQLLDCDWRASGGQPTWAGVGAPTIENNRIDGLYTVTAPAVDPQWHQYYELKPAGAVNLTTPQNFPAGKQVQLVLNANVTLVHAAGVLELAGGVNFTPGAAGAKIWLERAAGATKVRETLRLAY